MLDPRGQPASGATVWALVANKGGARIHDPADARRLTAGMPGALARAEGMTFRCDAGGRVAFDVEEGEQIHLAAGLGNLRAHGSCSAGEHGIDAPFVLRLRPDHLLRIVVVDPGQRPLAGVPVLVRMGARAGGYRGVAIGPTDARGEILFHEVDAWLERHGRSRPAGLSLLALVPGHTRVETFAPLPPPGSTLRLVVPRTGSLRVELVAPGGTALALDGVAVELAPHMPFEVAEEDEVEGDESPAAPTAPFDAVRRGFTREGVVRFTPVAVGSFVRVRAAALGVEVEVLADGPRQADQERVVRLQIPTRGTLLVGRVPGAHGFAPGWVSLVGHDLQTRGTGDTPIAEDGSFQLAIPARVPAPAIVRVEAEGSPPGWFALEGPRPEGRVDVGTVALRRPTLLLGGRVLRADGTFDTTARNLVVERRRAVGEDWQVLDLETEHLDEGRFEVRVSGPLPPGEYRVRVAGVDTGTPFAPGQGDVIVPDRR